MRLNLSLLLAAGVLSILLSSCGTCARFDVYDKPEINMPAGCKVAIGGIFDTRGYSTPTSGQVYNSIIDALINAKRYQVVSNEIIRSQYSDNNSTRRPSYLSDEDIRLQGQNIGAEYYVYGSISQDVYDEMVNHATNTDTSQKGKKYIITRQGTYSLSVNIKVVNTKTARIIFSKTYSSGGNATTRSFAPSLRDYTSVPDKINVEELVRNSVNKIIFRFYEELIPVKIDRWLCFEEPKDLPEIAQVAQRLNNGNAQAACDILLRAAGRRDISLTSKAEAFFDIGRIYEAYFDWTNAVEYYQRAHDIMPGEYRFTNELDNAIRKKRECEARIGDG